MTKRLLEPRWVGLALAVALMLAGSPVAVEAAMVRSRTAGEHDVTPRQAREAQVRRLLGEEQVAGALRSLGLRPDQVRSHLDRLTDPQLEHVARNLETVQAGGDPVLALTALSVVLLGILLYMYIETL